MTALDKAVADDPGLVPAWALLAEWAAEAEDWPRAHAAARSWVELAPLEAIAWGYRGTAERELGETDRAIESWRQATEVEPTYAYAAHNLAQLLRDRGNDGEAVEVLAGLGTASKDGETLGQVIVAVLKSGEHKHIVRWMLAMAQDPHTPVPVVREVLDAVETIPHLSATFERVAFEPTTKAPMSSVWAQRRAEPDIDLAWAQLHERTSGSEPWGQAAADLLRVEMRDNPRKALRRVNQHVDALTRPTASWGMVGYVYTAFRWHKRTIAALSDYPQRDHVEPWMLYNLAVAHKMQARFAEAYDVAQAALALPDDDGRATCTDWWCAGSLVRSVEPGPSSGPSTVCPCEGHPVDAGRIPVAWLEEGADPHAMRPTEGPAELIGAY